MHKQFLILLIIIFSAVGGLNILGQVVIKDEIILDEAIFEKQEPESAGLTMPFYGTVIEKVYWYSIACGNSRRELIVDGTNYQFGPCWSWECGDGSCTCATGFHLKEVTDVPMGTSVDTKFQRCWIFGGSGNPPSWGVLEHYFQLLSSTETHWSYEIKARLTENHPWQHAAYMDLMKTTPPGCYICSGSFDESCEECIDPQKLLPEINLVNTGNGFDSIDVCKDSTAAAGFNIVAVNALVNYNFELNACFNKQLQRWWFNITGDTLHFRYILDFCPQNIEELGGTLIENYQNFPSEYGCENIMQDMFGHLFYPPRISIGGYFVKSILIRHELEHKWYFQNILDELKNEFQSDMYTDPKNCADIPTTLEAYNYFVSIKTENLLKWWDKAIERRDKETGLKGFDKFDAWKQRILLAHENATQLKIYKYIFQKINAARNFYCL